MAKNVYRAYEVKPLEDKVFVQAPSRALAARVEEIKEIEAIEEVYEGPTADDLRREAELFKANWDRERETIVAGARAEAEEIVKQAEKLAFDEIKKQSENAAAAKEAARREAENIVAAAEARAKELESAALKSVAALEEGARARGFQDGREKGYADGRAEAQRLIERIHAVLTKTIEKRTDIIMESEKQLVQLVLQISKKVVKVLSENQKNIVINNVLQALKKLKSRTDIVIRVNLSDLNILTEHAKEIVEMFEKVKNVTVMEDSSVDAGGCIIETDFGQIDARIASQLREIEEKILDLMPIRQKEPTRNGE